MARFFVFFILGWILVSVSCPELAHAEDLPDSAPGVLADILEQEEFQPRGESVGLWERLKQELWATVLRKARDLLQALQEFIISTRPWEWDFPGAKALVVLFVRIAEVLYRLGEFAFHVGRSLLRVLLVVAALLLITMLLRRMGLIAGSTGSPEHCGAGCVAAVEEEMDANAVLELIARGNCLDALFVLRRLLRRRLEKRYEAVPSTTDRELLHRLPDSERERELFSKLAELFELITFAGREPEDTSLAVVLGAYREEMVAEGEVS